MIVLASDFVGFKVVNFLVEQEDDIEYLILDKKNKGEFNEKIISSFQTKYSSDTIYYNERLADKQFLKILEQKQIELGILAWWPYILKGKILSIPKIGWLNFHPSYLPYNKGKNPNFWCLVDQTKCGVSLHFIDEGIDSGDIVARQELDVNWEDTGQSIYEKSREKIIDLFKENFQNIKNNDIKRMKQKPREGTYHKSSEMDEIYQINLDEKYTARKLFNIIRAKMYPPYPTAFFYDNGKKYSVEITIKEIKE